MFSTNKQENWTSKGYRKIFNEFLTIMAGKKNNREKRINTSGVGKFAKTFALSNCTNQI